MRTPTFGQRARFLVDWARRDRAFGLRQCERDEAQFPGITRLVKDHLDMDEEACRRGANLRMVCAERARLGAMA